MRHFQPKPEIIPEQIVFPTPIFISAAAQFEYKDVAWKEPQYTLPLKNLPENYQRDLIQILEKKLTKEQKNILLSNGTLILEGDGFENFDQAFQYLAKNDIPIFITSDYLLHFFRIELSEILKNLELEKLSHILGKFLEGLLTETENQYVAFGERGEKAELARRNIAYLSVAFKLLNPSFEVSDLVKDEVNAELSKIESHKGLFLSEIFSQDCPRQCKEISSKGGEYIPVIGGEIIYYKKKPLDTLEFYKEVCAEKCYFENYSLYFPEGHYKISEDLENYYKTITFLKQMTFKLNGEDWTKQAILLTLAAEKAKIWYEGKEVGIKSLWKKIYSTLDFFSGGSKGLNFCDYGKGLNEIIFKNDLSKIADIDINKINFNEFRVSLGKLKGDEIFENFEKDIKGNLKEFKKGLTVLPKPSSLDSYIFKAITYKNVGPNPNAPNFREVQRFMKLWEKFDCDDIKTDIFEKGWSEEEYWQEICKASLQLYSNKPEKFYSLCKSFPSNIEMAALLDSQIAEEILKDSYKLDFFCNWKLQKDKLKESIENFSQEKWAQNLDNLWLWQFSSFFKEKSKQGPAWLKSNVWELKELITSLASFSGTRYSPILYRKESYEYFREKKEIETPKKYQGFLEPSPAIFAKMDYIVSSLAKGLEEQDLMTGKIFLALDKTSKICENLKNISEKELKTETLGKSDYDFIKELPESLEGIIGDLASVFVIKKGEPGLEKVKKIYLEGKEEAFKTSFIRDVFEESNFEKLLQIGSGKLDWIIVAHKVKNRIIISIGPIFSYYEFGWPKEDRLKNEKWRNFILKDMERPIWYSRAGISSSDESYIIK